MSKKGASFFHNVLSESSSQSTETPRPGRSFLGGELSKHREGVETELAALKQRYEGSFPTKKISTNQIHRGPWANRLEEAFDEDLDESFRTLKSQIKAHGGNAAPIFVRTVPDKETYELVYGERRWRACSQLGLDVQAVIGTISDEDAVLLQHHENQGRANISVVESAYQVVSWYEALKRGDSLRLADRLNITPSYLSNLRMIGANIPQAAVDAHPNIRALAYKSIRQLAVLYRDNPTVAQERVKQLKARTPVPSPTEATSFLLSGHWTASVEPSDKVATKARASFTDAGLVFPLAEIESDKRKRFLAALATLSMKFGIEIPTEGSK